MAPSLHTRLLLSYGLLIAVLMGLFSAGTLASLQRNPLVYATAAQALRSAQRLALARTDELQTFAGRPDPARLEQAARRLNVRIALAGSDGAIVADSETGPAARLRTPLVRLKLLALSNEIAFLRDEANRPWLALVQALDAQTYLVLAVRRPRLAVLEMFNSEYLRPVLLAGFAGLALAALIALALAQWISAPLQRIGAAADAVAAGQFQTIPPAGPVEVRRLAESFNRMVRRVQEAQQSQRELVANVSHELKTPLTSIQGFTQAILEGVSQTPDQVRQAAQVIFAESNRMSRLVQDLLALARLEAGAAELQRAPLDLGALLHGVAEKFRPPADKAGVQLELHVLELPRLVGDADRLAQVFSNLVDNALKFTPPGGSVEIRAQAQRGRLEICVADHGPGIPPAERERIFQRFYRADRSRPGAGLGLAIARQIVLAHGGTIRVEARQPQGSVFIVDLPTGDH